MTSRKEAIKRTRKILQKKKQQMIHQRLYVLIGDEPAPDLQGAKILRIRVEE